jgi:hypothetical protein
MPAKRSTLFRLFRGPAIGLLRVSQSPILAPITQQELVEARNWTLVLWARTILHSVRGMIGRLYVSLANGIVGVARLLIYATGLIENETDSM